MRMNLPPDRQGHLSDLSAKSLGELQELLERQEKILSRSTFVKTLPDKGEKCRQFATQLQDLINQRSTSSAAVPMTLTSQLTGSGSGNEESGIPAQVMTSVTERSGDNSELADSLQKLSLGKPTEVKQPPEIFHNSYERVVKKLETKPQKERFMPNRIPKSRQEMPSSPHPPPPAHTVTQTVGHTSYRPSIKSSQVPEESNVRPPEYKYKESKMISITESVQLIEEQRDRNQILVAEQAAQRLAAQMLPKMSVYSGGGGDMRYRAAKLPEQGDSDDEDDEDEKEIDYGDEAD